MQKIEQGEFEIFTTQKDAIDKLMQLDEDCRDESSSGYCLEFLCDKKGNIIISSPVSMHRRDSANQISSYLKGKVVERDGKTYVEYFTAYSKVDNVSKIIYIAIMLLCAVFAVFLAIVQGDSFFSIAFLVVGVAVCISGLSQSVKEKDHVTGDSKIMVQELKNRVDAVNMWDK